MAKKEKELEEMSMDEFAEARDGKSCQRLESIRIETAENGFVMSVTRRPEKKAKTKGNLAEPCYEPPQQKVFETAESLLAAVKKELAE